MYTDLTGRQLEEYRSSQVDPPDFDEFWGRTLSEARELPVKVELSDVDSPLRALTVQDVRFNGFGGERIAGWLRRPVGARGPLPTVVQYIGYGGGRGLATESLFWAACGFAHLQMDTRGQGGAWSVGATPDRSQSGPRFPGMMTAGIEDREQYYYRRLITDAVRLLDAAGEIDGIDPARIACYGSSQGGGLALAASSLSDVPKAALCCVPFLCDFPRAIGITDENPYREISKFLAVQRELAPIALSTLSYFDGVNFARRARARAWFTAALMDPICPPSTVFGAYQAYAGPKEITVWEYNGHEGGASLDEARFAVALHELFGE